MRSPSWENVKSARVWVVVVGIGDKFPGAITGPCRAYSSRKKCRKSSTGPVGNKIKGIQSELASRTPLLQSLLAWKKIIHDMSPMNSGTYSFDNHENIRMSHVSYNGVAPRRERHFPHTSFRELPRKRRDETTCLGPTKKDLGA